MFCDEEPLSFEDVCEDEHWMAAMQSKLGSIHKNGTWKLCDSPQGKNAIGTKWAFTIKRTSDGSIDCFKARLAAKGYAQQYGIDYEETFAPIACMMTIHTIDALATHCSWKVHQLDVKITFLNGDLQEEVYVKQPLGYTIKGQEHKVCHLCKALCGLKQAPCAWYDKIQKHLIALWFKCSPIESTLYVHRDGDDLIVLVLYVDEMLTTGSRDEKVDAFITYLQKLFIVTNPGILCYYL